MQHLNMLYIYASSLANQLWVGLEWNPSVEDQAIARTMRLGQVERILVIRYVVQESVERVGQ